MQEITYKEALRQAMIEEMEGDPAVFMFGQDIGLQGGMWGVTAGLMDKFGPERIIDSPISEIAQIGAGLGAAMAGQRPIVEIMYADFLLTGMDPLVNQVAKSRYMFAGQVKVPLVIRSMIGYGFGLAAAHSQSLENMLSTVPGLYVALPGTPASAKGLLKAAIRNDNPVVFLEHTKCYLLKGEVPDDPDFMIPLGKASILRSGKDITIVSWSMMVSRCLEAAAILEKEGIDVEVIDLQTTAPLDMSTVMDSVKHTGRLVVTEQTPPRCGVAAEIVAQVSESGMQLKAPPKRLSGKDIPNPFAENLEKLAVPKAADIVAAARSLAQ